MVPELDCKHEHPPGNEKAIDIDRCERAAAIFRALGDSNRLRLLCLLMHREMCVSEMTLLLEDNVPAVSQRLKLLRSERIVKQRRQGKHIFYRLLDDHVRHLIEIGLAHGDEHRSPSSPIIDV